MTVFFLDPAGGADFPYDASNSARTLTIASTVTSVGDNPKFGRGSLSFNLPGAITSSNVTVSDAADWTFTGQFTAEAWVYLTATSGGTTAQVIAAQGNTTTSNLSWALSINPAQTALQFQYSTSGTAWTLLSGSKTFAQNTWYHVAVDRDSGGVIRIYVDGVMLNSVTMGTALFNSTFNLAIGNYSPTSTVGRFPGLIEELRITTDVARYASNSGYTVPTDEFPSNSTDDAQWANVKLLLRSPGGRTVKGRFKSFAALTALRVSPGDSARLPASPAPAAMGNATWTNGSRVVTLASAVTANIDTCDTTWTAVGTNVTQSTNTNIRKHGTGDLQLTLAAAFSTGKVAYKTFGAPLDLSAFQQVSFWFRASTTPAANTLELRLCSDTLGDVPVHVIPLTEFTVGGTWRAIVKDFGAALSSSIASISVYASADPGTLTLYLDNIVACKASSSADALTHLSLIGKNTAGEPEWYPIGSIDGTTVEIGNYAEGHIGTTAATPRPYYGTGETVTLYRLQPLDYANGQANSAFNTANRTLAASGSDGNPLTISGGWDSTYTSQTGVSWVSGAHGMASFLDYSSRSFVRLEKVGAAHFYSSVFLASSGSSNCSFQLEGVVGCFTPYNTTAFGVSLYLDVGNVMACGAPISITPSVGDFTLVGRRIFGSLGRALELGVGPGNKGYVYIDQADSCATYAVGGGGQQLYSNPVVLHNLKMVNNVSGDVITGNVNLVFINAQLQSTSKVVLASTTLGEAVRFQNYDLNPNDHRNYLAWGSFTSDTTIRHAATGLAWKMSVTSATLAVSQKPASMPLMRRYLAAGVTATISCWMRRDNVGLTCGIKVRRGALAGISADVSASMTAAADTWQQVSITVTPTESGVVELTGWAYGGTTYSCWFDDITVT